MGNSRIRVETQEVAGIGGDLVLHHVLEGRGRVDTADLDPLHDCALGDIAVVVDISCFEETVSPLLLLFFEQRV